MALSISDIFPVLLVRVAVDRTMVAYGLCLYGTIVLPTVPVASKMWKILGIHLGTFMYSIKGTSDILITVLRAHQKQKSFAAQWYVQPGKH